MCRFFWVWQALNSWPITLRMNLASLPVGRRQIYDGVRLILHWLGGIIRHRTFPVASKIATSMKTTRFLLSFLLLILALPAAFAAEDAASTIRICDRTGCSDRPINRSAAPARTESDSVADRRLAALEEAAHRDPRAAYDLGLRYFRGDDVRQDSYQALQWMRDAAERGDLHAQLAVGGFYLMGLEEMGSDPAEAEKWLSIAAGRGSKEAKKLLSEASAAKRKSQAEYQRWVDSRRHVWYGYWYRSYPYRAYWRNGAWYYY